jgi:serine/threonine-protein kinase RIO1
VLRCFEIISKKEENMKEIRKTSNSIRIVEGNVVIEFSAKDVDKLIDNSTFYDIEGTEKKGIRLKCAEVFLALTDDEVKKLKEFLKEEEEKN